jgi:uncharacterized protein
MKGIIGAIILACVSTAVAAAPPSDQSIDALLAASHVDRMLEPFQQMMEASLRQGIAAALQGRTLNPAQQRVVDALPAKFAAIAREELSFDKLRATIVPVYRETFTQEEVDGMIAFYSSPIGRSVVDKLPVVTQKIQAQMQPLMPPIVDRMKALMTQTIVQLQLSQ